VAELRALGLEALRIWRQRPAQSRHQPDAVERQTSDVFLLKADFGIELIKLLAQHKRVLKPDIGVMQHAFDDDDAMHTVWMGGVLEFLWWLERAGLAVAVEFGKKRNPSYPNQPDQRWYPAMMRLTSKGVRLIDGSDDNPILPGFLDRIRVRCPSLPDDVIALLVDALACCDHSLMRPAVVLMGVAYELAIEHVVDVLASKNLVSANTPGQKPGERIKRIKELLATPQVNTVLPNSDDRIAAGAAYDFADHLRQRRNEAAHTTPIYDFDHTAETEEFLVSAGRHLPALWSLAV